MNGYLEHIAISGDQITKENATVLSKLPKLAQLNISVAAAEATDYLDVPNLKSLTLRWRFVDDEEFPQASYQALVRLANLETLHIEGAAGSPDDESLQTLAKLPRLKSLKRRSPSTLCCNGTTKCGSQFRQHP